MDSTPHVLSEYLLGEFAQVQLVDIGEHLERGMHVRVELEPEILALQGHSGSDGRLPDPVPKAGKDER